jgi:hypothetical protein
MSSNQDVMLLGEYSKSAEKDVLRLGMEEQFRFLE